MTTETIPTTEPAEVEYTSPRVRSEIYIDSNTRLALWDFGTGAHLLIGEFFGSNTMIQLGCDERSRRDACDRLIRVLTGIWNWQPAPEPLP